MSETQPPRAPQPAPPDEQQIESLLTALGQARPGPRFYRRLDAQPWMKERDQMKKATNRMPGAAMLAASAFVLTLTLLAFMATPQGQTLARSVFQYFTPASDGAPPAPGSTVAVLETQLPGPLPAHDPSPDLVTDPTPNEGRIELPLEQAEALAGYKAWLPDRLPSGYALARTSFLPDTRGIVAVYEYRPPVTGEFIIIGQAPNGEFEAAGPGTEAEPVVVGAMITGEFFQGGWLTPAGASASEWHPESPVYRLRWREDDRAIEIAFLGNEPDSPAFVTKAELQAMAALIRLDRARDLAGFDLKLPPGDLEGLVFLDASFDPASQSVQLRYQALGGGAELTITQAVGAAPGPTAWEDGPPSNQVEPVSVGGHEGEYVMGAFVTRPDQAATIWAPQAPLRRLRWREDDRLFEIRLGGHTAPVEHLDRDTLIALAESLTYTPAPADLEPGSSLPASAAELESMLGFDLLEPALLPEGFAFSMAEADPSGASRARLVYEYGDRPGVAAIVLFQALTDDDAMDLTQSYPTGVVQPVTIDGADGQYAMGVYGLLPFTPTPGAATPTPVWTPGSGHQALVWRAGDRQLELYFFAGESYDGPALAQADLIRIAESLK